MNTSGVAVGLVAAVRRRGFDLRPASSEAKLLLPAEELAREEIYELLLHYSFRLVLRDILVHRDSFAEADLRKYCSPECVARYVAVLEQTGLIERAHDGRSFRLAKESVDSLGDTLEWLSAEILRRDFGMETAWSVRLGGAPGGGDYDVLALAEGDLLYVETKSAPPRHVHRREITGFFDRLAALRPAAAILLEDTKLRMADKLLVMFEEELERRFGAGARHMARLEDETFVLADKLFLTNAAPDLTAALGRCVVHYFRHRPYCMS